MIIYKNVSTIAGIPGNSLSEVGCMHFGQQSPGGVYCCARVHGSTGQARLAQDREPRTQRHDRHGSSGIRTSRPSHTRWPLITHSEMWTIENYISLTGSWFNGSVSKLPCNAIKKCIENGLSHRSYWTLWENSVKGFSVKTIYYDNIFQDILYVWDYRTEFYKYRDIFPIRWDLGHGISC